MANGSNGDGTLKLTTIVSTLIAFGIIGAVGIGFAQSGIKTQVEANKAELDRRQPLVAVIPVIQNDIQHIKNDMAGIRDSQEKILDAVEESNRRRQ